MISSPRSTAELDLEAFIRDYLAEVEPLLRACNDQSWLANTTGERRYEEESARLESQLRLYHARREPLDRLLALERGREVREPGLVRQLRLLILDFQANQFPAETIER